MTSRAWGSAAAAAVEGGGAGCVLSLRLSSRDGLLDGLLFCFVVGLL